MTGPRCDHTYWSKDSTVQGSGVCAVCGVNIFHIPLAQGIEAQRAETTKIGSVHESPVGNADAPKE